MPRSLKICTAVVESLSETRTRGAMTASLKGIECVGKWWRPRGPPRISGRCFQRRLLRGKGPVEPWQQRFEIRCLDGRAAPDAQARWRVAIGADVVGDAFLVERRDDALGECRLTVGIERRHIGIGEGEADRGVRARRRIDGQMAEPR